MAYQFRKHYTVNEARALLPQVRLWLKELGHLRQRLGQYDERLGELLNAGIDAGGETVNNWVKALCGVKKMLREFQTREIQIKDLDRGLIDFPALIAGQEAFLCWEQDEDDIEFWHDLESGYAGRERLLPGASDE
jgi:hypothetical protein